MEIATIALLRQVIVIIPPSSSFVIVHYCCDPLLSSSIFVSSHHIVIIVHRRCIVIVHHCRGPSSSSSVVVVVVIVVVVVVIFVAIVVVITAVFRPCCPCCPSHHCSPTPNTDQRTQSLPVIASGIPIFRYFWVNPTTILNRKQRSLACWQCLWLIVCDYSYGLGVILCEHERGRQYFIFCKAHLL